MRCFAHVMDAHFALEVLTYISHAMLCLLAVYVLYSECGRVAVSWGLYGCLLAHTVRVRARVCSCSWLWPCVVSLSCAVMCGFIFQKLQIASCKLRNCAIRESVRERELPSCPSFCFYMLWLVGVGSGRTAPALPRTRAAAPLLLLLFSYPRAAPFCGQPTLSETRERSGAAVIYDIGA